MARFCFTRHVIGSENSRHILNNQIQRKKIVTWSPAFSHALNSLLFFSLRFLTLCDFFPLFWLAVMIILLLVLQSAIETRTRSNALKVKRAKGQPCSRSNALKVKRAKGQPCSRSNALKVKRAQGQTRPRLNVLKVKRGYCWFHLTSKKSI